MFSRELTGGWEKVTHFMAAMIPILGVLMILNVFQRMGLTVFRQQYLAIFIMLTLLIIFMKAPMRSADKGRIPWYDFLFMAMAAAGCIFVAVTYPWIRLELGNITPVRIIFGAMTLFTMFEAVRRVSGWILVVLGAVFMVYALISESLPGQFYSRSVSLDRLITFLYLDTEGVFGLALDTIGIVVLGFILFGDLLFLFGAGEWLTQVAVKGLGRMRGGPAQIAVVTSALFGTVSGSAAANVAFTGKVTIPLMKKVGYKPAFAAAIESSASTAGLITPPILGATGFIMAEFLKVPYTQVVIASILPAFLYYLVMMVQIDQEAARTGLRGLSREEIGEIVTDKLRHGLIFLIPLVVLFVFLFVFYLPPALVAVYASFSILVVSLLTKMSRNKLKDLWHMLAETGYSLIQPAAISAIAGVIIGVVSLQGLGSMLSQMLLGFANDNLLVLLLFTALVSIILGMGMPAVAIYVLLAVLVAPALESMGISAMAAHMFIVYFGIMSYITPPMAFACFIAAPMAGAPLMRTAFTAMRLSLAAYIVPFFFVFFPALLFEGSASEVWLATFRAGLGTLCVAFAVGGYWLKPLNIPWRVLFGVAGCLFLLPYWWADTLAALVILVHLGMVFSARYHNKKVPVVE